MRNLLSRALEVMAVPNVAIEAMCWAAPASGVPVSPFVATTPPPPPPEPFRAQAHTAPVSARAQSPPPPPPRRSLSMSLRRFSAVFLVNER
ncbi:hypothetical protein C8Q74DRAFT_1370382 [Fomes fomentarius]|nr:hypothetical protein C8Q74DRAFT_1370382 [Fomes fomentarius]